MLNFGELNKKLCRSGAKVVFLGAGGVSMSSLALVMKERGVCVAGYDRVRSSACEALERAGIIMYYDFDEQMYENAVLVVYTGAISRESQLVSYALSKGIEAVERPVFLGALMKEKKNRIGVSGTHGKSTTTGMITRIFDEAGLDPVSLNGATMPEYGGNMRRGKGDDFIFEACEYRNSFLDFFPTVAVILNVEYDHADFFPDLNSVIESFSRFVAKADSAVVNIDCEGAAKAVEGYTGKLWRASLADRTAQLFADDIICDGGKYSYNLVVNGVNTGRVELGICGKHNVMNSLEAAGAALISGVSAEAIKRGLKAFKGVARRFEHIGKTLAGAELYSDYAHHPDEIRATLATAKKVARKRVFVIFQPHTYSRTKQFFDDFAAAFAEADSTVFADIYAARETDDLGVSSALLAKHTKNAVYFPDDEEIISFIEKNAGEGDLVIVMGAGDIDRLCARLS